ncbi:MAG: hypothetical protein M1818_003669 [Claussenomyces sp. TS43310]|nr:MAG: hypothetical protein M1818_003669 [Claussenomyces sp. TS43310]
MPIDHLAIVAHSAHYDQAVKFYTAMLEPLGYKKLAEFKDGDSVGFGDAKRGFPDFWLNKSTTIAPPIHLAFSAESHSAVDASYKAALEAGGKDNGAPGPRPDYGPEYYGAFLIDPLGNNVEAVDHGSPA